MKLVVVDNIHLFKTNDGIYHSPSIIDDKFLSRYTEEFDDVVLIAKVKMISDEESKGYLTINTDNIKVVELPFFQGLLSLFVNLPIILLKLYEIDNTSIVLFRMSQVESIIYWYLKNNKRYFLEIVNDPDLFLSGILKTLTKLTLNNMIRNAIGVSTITTRYITEKYVLIKELPIMGVYNTIDLSTKDYHFNKSIKNEGGYVNILHVSNVISDNSKGHKEFLKIIRLLLDKGMLVNGKIIGQGKYVHKLKQYCKKLGITNNIEFIKRLASRDLLLNHYRGADFFVFPTKIDLQGRVIIEAMANSLPVISTKIGGIPELIDSEYLFEIGDYKGMANKILEIHADVNKLAALIEKNYNKTLDFSEEKNGSMRKQFYQLIKSSLN